jgi:hypothetical protein
MPSKLGSFIWLPYPFVYEYYVVAHQLLGRTFFRIVFLM